MTLSRRVRDEEIAGTLIRVQTICMVSQHDQRRRKDAAAAATYDAEATIMTEQNRPLEGQAAATPIGTSRAWTDRSAPGGYPAKRREQLSTSGPKGGFFLLRSMPDLGGNKGLEVIGHEHR